MGDVDCVLGKLDNADEERKGEERRETTRNNMTAVGSTGSVGLLVEGLHLYAMCRDACRKKIDISLCTCMD